MKIVLLLLLLCSSSAFADKDEQKTSQKAASAPSSKQKEAPEKSSSAKSSPPKNGSEKKSSSEKQTKESGSSTTDNVDRSTKAFPEAVGFGAYTQGGRGGKVLHVTKLSDDNSEGTLRWACSQKGKRIVVFDVAGTITLFNALNIEEPFLTIDGGTAPAGGITICGYPLYIKKTHDIIISHLRCRTGDLSILGKGAFEGKKASKAYDGISIGDSEWIIFNHLSVSWSIDECIGTQNARHTTFMNCLIAEPLGARGEHPDRPDSEHAFGMLFGGEGQCTAYRNVFYCCRMRAPQCGESESDVVNNLNYKFSHSGAKISTNAEKDTFHQLGYNMYINDDQKPPELSIHVRGDKPLTLYYEENAGPHGKGKKDREKMIGGLADVKSITFAEKPIFDTGTLTNPLPPEELEKELLETCGAYLSRDEVDERVVKNIRERKGDFINSQDDVGGYPDLSSIKEKKEYSSPFTDSDEETEKAAPQKSAPSTPPASSAEKKQVTAAAAPSSKKESAAKKSPAKKASETSDEDVFTIVVSSREEIPKALAKAPAGQPIKVIVKKDVEVGVVTVNGKAIKANQIALKKEQVDAVITGINNVIKELQEAVLLLK